MENIDIEKEFEEIKETEKEIKEQNSPLDLEKILEKKQNGKKLTPREKLLLAELEFKKRKNSLLDEEKKEIRNFVNRVMSPTTKKIKEVYGNELLNGNLDLELCNFFYFAFENREIIEETFPESKKLRFRRSDGLNKRLVMIDDRSL